MFKNSTTNQSLTERALDRLKDDIVFGYHRSGAKLNIESLKKRYEMGGTPVREALNQLLSWSVVEALPLKGFRVMLLSTQRAEEVYRARLLLEKDMLEKSVVEGDDNWEAQCMACCHRLKRCVENKSFIEAPDLRKWFELFTLFHRAVFLRGASDCLWQFERQLLLRSKQYEFAVYTRSAVPLPFLMEQFRFAESLLSACLEQNVALAWSRHEGGVLRTLELMGSIEEEGV